MNMVLKITLITIMFKLVGNATILNTKHNLSVTGKGNIKAATETEVCVFCHTPHGGVSGKPLWNRNLPTASYTTYQSDLLYRMGKSQASGLGSSKDEPGAISRQCLSCHDGTVAIGSVHVLRAKLQNGQQISMTGTGAGGTMPSDSVGDIGTDLSFHHPVGVEYTPNIAKNFGSGTKTSELKAVPDAPLKLYNYGGRMYVECSSCHDPHVDNKKFLRVTSGANHGQNVKNTCISCHDKSGGAPWPTTHEVIGMPYRDSEVVKKYGTSNPGDLFCINCHTPHNGEGRPYLLRKVEQQTCFQGAASSPALSSCHGTGAVTSAPDIESVLLRSYGHPVSEIDGVHTALDVLYGTGVRREPAGSKGLSWSDSKHAECMDCHNPHKLGSKSHVDKGQWYPANPTNRVSQVLRGVNGVEPNWTPRWTQPTTFTTLESAEKEYQICLKCHSYWALGTAVDGVTSHLLSNSGIQATDQAWEFNPNNRSAHPVIMPLNQMTGNYEPKALDASQMKEPWKNVGNQTMYCSDCHGADNEIGGDPRGPHGSNYKFMLKGKNNYWPTKPGGEFFTVAGSMRNGNAQVDDGLFCKNCHNLLGDSAHVHSFGGTLGMDGPCVFCHVAVPHGSPVSRLIGYRSFPEPYNYRDPESGLLMLKIDGFRKGSKINSRIDSDAVYSTHPSCMFQRGAVGFCHSLDHGGYDSYP